MLTAIRRLNEPPRAFPTFSHVHGRTKVHSFTAHFYALKCGGALHSGGQGDGNAHEGTLPTNPSRRHLVLESRPSSCTPAPSPCDWQTASASPLELTVGTGDPGHGGCGIWTKPGAKMAAHCFHHTHIFMRKTQWDNFRRPP